MDGIGLYSAGHRRVNCPENVEGPSIRRNAYVNFHPATCLHMSFGHTLLDSRRFGFFEARDQSRRLLRVIRGIVDTRIFSKPLKGVDWRRDSFRGHGRLSAGKRPARR